MLKKLIGLISTKGKTEKQVIEEIVLAHQKYQKTSDNDGAMKLGNNLVYSKKIKD